MTSLSVKILVLQGVVTVSLIGVLSLLDLLSIELLIVTSYLGFLLIVQLVAGNDPIREWPRWLKLAMVGSTLVVCLLFLRRIGQIVVG